MPSLKILTIGEIEIRADLGAALLIAMVTLSFSRTGPLGAGLGAVLAIGILISLLLHELGHALAVRSLGYGRSRITLSMFGGVTQWGGEPTPRHHALVAAAGPLATALCAAACAGVAALAAGSYAGAILTQLWQLNLLWLVFNLLPILPLDGGTILYSGLRARMGDERAHRVATMVSLVLALTAAVCAYLIANNTWATLLLGMLAWRSWQAWQTPSDEDGDSEDPRPLPP
jgi:Zn-dependent protease